MPSITLPFGKKNLKNVVPYMAGDIFLANVSSSGTTDATSWQPLGFVQSVKISTQVENFSQVDNHGKKIVNTDTLQSAEVDITFLERDESVRNCTQSSSAYSVCVVGANIDASGSPKHEIWVFPNSTFTKSFSYGIGDKEAKIQTKLMCNAAPVAYTLTLPTSGQGIGFVANPTSVTIGAGDIYSTFDA